jgi:hypothetical protein
MSTPTAPHLYCKGRVYVGKRMLPFVIWDGRRDYESHPPPNLLLAENLTGRVYIAQVRNPKVGTETLAALLEGCDSVILWARNTAVYRAVVKNINKQSDGWLS